MSQHRRTVAKARCLDCNKVLAPAEALWCNVCQDRYHTERAELESRDEKKK